MQTETLLNAELSANTPQTQALDDDALPLDILKSENGKPQNNEPQQHQIESKHNTQQLIGHKLNSFLAQETPVRESILGPWLVTQGLAMVYATRGIGKTYFALNIAYAAATAGEYLHWDAPITRKVLYIDGEMPASAMQDRLREISTNDNRGPIDEQDNLTIVSQELQAPTMPDLSTVEGQLIFNQLTEHAELIIIDNLSTLCGSISENDADDWDVVANWLLRMRKEGKSVLLIHHAGKGGKQRGTSRREDILDVVIALKGQSVQAGGASFEIHFEKARHLFGPDTQTYLATKENTMWSSKPVHTNPYNQTVALKQEGFSNAEIAKKLGIDKSTVGRRLTAAQTQCE